MSVLYREGMAVGEKKALKCKPEEAYGEVNPANVMKVPKAEVGR